MLSLIPKKAILPFSYISCNTAKRLSDKIQSESSSFTKRGTEQVDYIKKAIENKNLDWSALKTKVLSITGQLNKKNYDGVLLKILTNGNHFDAALTYADYIKNSSELTLGATNGLLSLYYEISKQRHLTGDERNFIIETYISLYKKYKVLDYTTCEKLIRALCAIDEYEKALKVLDNIFLTSIPSHTAYSIIIGTLFKNNKKKNALDLVKKSIENKRPLQYLAYHEWINYIFRKYKEKNTILKHFDDIFSHISKNYAIIDEKTALQLKKSFEILGWNPSFTKIRKINGQCMQCAENLDQLEITEQEFTSLQKNVKEKLILGSDLFLKTSPEELKRFTSFVENTAPYDIVIDSLNVAYTSKGSPVDRINMLSRVVEYFKKRNKKILLLGRKHMLKWGRGKIEQLKRDTCNFFTENLSEDDPFFITAAILSGPKTDIVSKDLLRGHQFLLQDEQLRYIFRRWQWQHQWMVYITRKGVNIQAPLSFTPCAQKKNGGWHLPYEREDVQESKGLNNDGTPDLSSWLCITPENRINK